MNTHQLVSLTNVKAERCRWLWPRYIPEGAITLLDGDPGCGKSLLTVDLAARLTRGQPLPDGSRVERSKRVLFLNAEDNLETVVMPRLLAAGACIEHVYSMQATGCDGLVQLPRDLNDLESRIREAGIDVVFIDPIVAFMPMSLSLCHEQSVRSMLMPLSVVAARTGCAFVLVRHLNKKQGQRSLYRGIGAIGLTGTARSAMLAAKHPHRPDCFVLTVSKQNLEEPPPAQVYRIVSRDGVGAIEWLEAEHLSADEAVIPKVEEAPGVFRAMEWLLTVLTAGPRPAAELLKEARTAGIREKTLERAKRNAKVESRLQHVDGKRHWTWQLPAPPTPPILDPIPDDLLPDHRAAFNALPKAGRDVINQEQLSWAAGVLKGRSEGKR